MFPLVGKRLKCLECNNFDLCGECFDRIPETHTHTCFMRVFSKHTQNTHTSTSSSVEDTPEITVCLKTVSHENDLKTLCEYLQAGLGVSVVRAWRGDNLIMGKVDLSNKEGVYENVCTSVCQGVCETQKVLALLSMGFEDFDECQKVLREKGGNVEEAAVHLSDIA
eukprot:GHVR01061958.1.p1 GENE.GHVR01061958.1~~GHVR01061958.1.p1  ORF type:complete len:166 (+),score=60.67 GHVR01061958.1:182-679(+)